MDWKVLEGDCVLRLRELEEATVDAIVTDPPYGLRFMGKEFDCLGDGPAQEEWHRVWAVEALRVLKPGGYLLAFGGSRTYHRLVCGVEDAGFEIRDQVQWLYATGFPKSRNLKDNYEGWGTALKPAHEPIVVARKPLIGTVAENVLAWGTGALNIDGCRIGTERLTAHGGGQNEQGSRVYGGGAGVPAIERGSNEWFGRWPANVVMDEEAAGLLDEQTGKTSSRFFYCAKASKGERNAGLDGFPLIKGGSMNGEETRPDRPTNHPFRQNHHPTVKPISLMRYLVRLVTPPEGTVLDPFLGSGTTGIAAVLEGFEFIGIEREADYLEIAEARIRYWSRRGVQLNLMDDAA